MRVLIILLPLLICSCQTMRAPEASFDEKFLELDPWKDTLQRFVDDQGRIDFSGIKANPSPLEYYLSSAMDEPLTVEPISHDLLPEIICHQVNLYNALAMYHAATSGIKPKTLARFFVLSKFYIGGQKHSLRSFENNVIRRLGEPRIHFVLNCMVKSCPRLLKEPLVPHKLEEQLEMATKEFINDPRHIVLDSSRQQVGLSRILTWYEKDYLKNHSSLLAFINAYRETPIPLNYSIRTLDYDWSLNDQ